jgi:hypothetical protein
VAYKEVVAANDRKFQFLPYYAHFAEQLELTWAIRCTAAWSGC